MACEVCGHSVEEHILAPGDDALTCQVAGCECKEYEEAEEYEDDPNPDFDYEEAEFLIDGVGFADPGGNSALRAETPTNPRNLPCPTCRRPNRLTPLDVAAGYQCDSCADELERGYDM